MKLVLFFQPIHNLFLYSVVSNSKTIAKLEGMVHRILAGLSEANILRTNQRWAFSTTSGVPYPLCNLSSAIIASHFKRKGTVQIKKYMFTILTTTGANDYFLDWYKWKTKI